MKKFPDFLVKATNVYRTKKYIVRQILLIQNGDINGCVLFSNDTFFLRTKKRDADYNLVFGEQTNVEGRRLHSTAYSRKYIN